jgi:hypothetical protein
VHGCEVNGGVSVHVVLVQRPSDEQEIFLKYSILYIVQCTVYCTEHKYERPVFRCIRMCNFRVQYQKAFQ